MTNAYLDRGRIFRIEVIYPDAAYEKVEAWDGELEELRPIIRLNRSWQPDGWVADPDWIARFDTDRFFWPAIKPFYNSRSTAEKRARLFRQYGAKAVVRRSTVIEWEYSETEMLRRRVEELEQQLSSVLT